MEKTSSTGCEVGSHDASPACCEMCGRPGAHRFGGQWICDECNQGCGSCCPEFGREEADAGEPCPN